MPLSSFRADARSARPEESSGDALASCLSFSSRSSQTSLFNIVQVPVTPYPPVEAGVAETSGGSPPHSWGYSVSTTSSTSRFNPRPRVGGDHDNSMRNVAALQDGLPGRLRKQRRIPLPGWRLATGGVKVVLCLPFDSGCVPGTSVASANSFINEDISTIHHPHDIVFSRLCHAKKVMPPSPCIMLLDHLFLGVPP